VSISHHCIFVCNGIPGFFQMLRIIEMNLNVRLKKTTVFFWEICLEIDFQKDHHGWLQRQFCLTFTFLSFGRSHFRQLELHALMKMLFVFLILSSKDCPVTF
jgi:hypothetical protein